MARSGYGERTPTTGDTVSTHDLDEVRRELARISAELAEPFDGSDLGHRLDLKERQQELRTLAREAADASDPEALMQRAEQLERRLEEMAKRRLSGSSIGGSGGQGGGGIDPYEASELNRRIDEGSGVAELRAELDRVRARLSRLRSAEERSTPAEG